MFALPGRTQSKLTEAQWQSLYKQACYCFEAGQHEQAVAINNTLLFQSDIPADVAAQVIHNRELSLEALYPKVAQPPATNNKIKVFVYFRSPGRWLLECLDSLKFQDYEVFQVYFADDGCSDSPPFSIPADHGNVTLTRNETSLGWSDCLHACLTHGDADDLIFPLDGRLAYCDALTIVNEFFNSYDCSIMYGQYKYSSGELGLTFPIINPDVSNVLRKLGYSPVPFIFRCRAYQELVSDASALSLLSCSEDTAQRALYYALLDHCGLDQARFSNQILTIMDAGT